MDSKILVGGYAVNFLNSLKNAADLTSTAQVLDILHKCQNEPNVEVYIPDYKFVKAFQYKEK